MKLNDTSGKTLAEGSASPDIYPGQSNSVAVDLAPVGGSGGAVISVQQGNM